MAEKRTTPTERDGLTPKQALFVEAYIGKAKGNGTEAARLAGYKGNDKTLQAVGKENLAKPLISQAVKHRLESAKQACGADQVLAELAAAALRPWDSLGVLEPKDKLKALELLGKYHKLFTEKREDSGVIEVIVKREARIGTTETN